MYAGTTLSNGSGKHVGVHQKIDKIAYRSLFHFLSKKDHFPSIKDVIYFEGNNGPDGIKRKGGSAADEPWHFINPEDPMDGALVDMISDHIFNLSQALKAHNSVRASFEAAWLAHAIVDGLTPAHHYPLGDKIEELWGKAHDERSNVKSKLVIKGSGLKDTIAKNWQYMGADGVFTAHLMFEAGVASVVTEIRYKQLAIENNNIVKLRENGFEAIFMDSVSNIYSLKMYDEFGKTGWTYDLAKKTKKVLLPEMVRMVTLAWYQAVIIARDL